MITSDSLDSVHSLRHGSGPKDVVISDGNMTW